MQKYKLFITIVLFFTLKLQAIGENCGLCAERLGGRLGDFVVTYVKTKWLSYKYNIPIALIDLTFLKDFELYQKENSNASVKKKYKKIIRIKTEEHLMRDKTNNALYIITRPVKLIDNLFDNIYANPIFKANLIQLLQTTSKEPLITLPKDMITVAVHVRKGGGHDPALSSLQLYNHEPVYITQKGYADKIWPEKFPPNQFYIYAIKKLSELVNHQSLYVYLFTDDSQPEELVQIFKEAVNLPNVQFDGPKNEEQRYKLYNFKDVYDMAQFDCLIRSEGSMYGWFAEFLGHHKQILYPSRFRWQNNKLLIDEIKIINREY